MKSSAEVLARINSAGDAGMSFDELGEDGPRIWGLVVAGQVYADKHRRFHAHEKPVDDPLGLRQVKSPETWEQYWDKTARLQSELGLVPGTRYSRKGNP